MAYHTTAAWTLIGLWVFAIFWHFTTGEWKQYIPTTEKVVAMANYYLFGIFRNAPHPFKLTQLRKHNPLQRLAYLAILVCVGPLIWVTGVLYLFYDKWAAWGFGKLSLEWVANGHIAGAFMMSNKYESFTTILVQRDEILNPLISYQMAIAMASEDRLRTFAEIINSHTTIKKLRDSLYIVEEADEPLDEQAVFAAIRQLMQPPAASVANNSKHRIRFMAFHLTRHVLCAAAARGFNLNAI